MLINELIDEMVNVKNKRNECTALDKELSKTQAMLESDLMNLMSTAGTTKAAIVDWDLFYEIIKIAQDNIESEDDLKSYVYDLLIGKTKLENENVN